LQSKRLNDDFLLNKIMEFDTRITKVETMIESMREDIQEIKNQLNHVSDVVTKISTLETSLGEIKALLDITKNPNNTSKSLKYILLIIIAILSFISTMFGLGWRPPTP